MRSEKQTHALAHTCYRGPRGLSSAPFVPVPRIEYNNTCARTRIANHPANRVFFFVLLRSPTRAPKSRPCVTTRRALAFAFAFAVQPTRVRVRRTPIVSRDSFVQYPRPASVDSCSTTASRDLSSDVVRPATRALSRAT